MSSFKKLQIDNFVSNNGEKNTVNDVQKHISGTYQASLMSHKKNGLNMHNRSSSDQ